MVKSGVASCSLLEYPQLVDTLAARRVRRRTERMAQTKAFRPLSTGRDESQLALWLGVCLQSASERGQQAVRRERQSDS